MKAETHSGFIRFSNAFEAIKNKPDFAHYAADEFRFTVYELQKIKDLSLGALDLLKGSTVAAGLGAATAYAAYAGTLALGTASTGTAISALSGVAAHNAALAALGGGSLATGGGGMALGTSVLGGAVAGPLLAVGGLLLNSKGNSSLEKADEIKNSVSKAVEAMENGTPILDSIVEMCDLYCEELERVRNVYDTIISDLEKIVLAKTDYNRFSEPERETLLRSIKITKIAATFTAVPLILEKDGETIVPDKQIRQALHDTMCARRAA
ncbi:hypothetical protein ROR02_12240 [Pararhodospirillum oryzae]|uniref:Uncharacterized protein n=2 Tax=Pararhodospirillum oryzae TaxID=478448 RepID=A0A512H6L6_9PROT|nr:hypothetical protein ROR02_12240 [Pararhodospirillum oryzae]